MQDYNAVSKWHFESEIGEKRGMVSLAEQDGITALRVRFADGDTETATIALTLAQAEFLIDALPAALNVVRARQERRAWEASLYDPFADICADIPDKNGVPQTGPSQPASKAVAKTPAQIASAAGDAPDDMASADLPIPARRGVPWTAAEEKQLAESHGAGQSVDALADQFDRSPFAITKRLEKLGLIEAKAA